MDAVRIIATGPPGHGSSTFLNELLGGEEKFGTSAGTAPCTVAGDQSNVFTMRGFDLSEGEKITVEMIDTPGMPYPDDPALSEANYKDLMEKCNRPLNDVASVGIAIVVNPERKSMEQLIETCAKSFKELQQSNRKVFIIANGKEACKRTSEQEDAYRERREKGRKDMLECANRFAKAAGLESAPVKVSFCVEDLEQAGRDMLREVLRDKPARQEPIPKDPIPRPTPDSTPTYGTMNQESTPVTDTSNNSLTLNQIFGIVASVVVVGVGLGVWLTQRHPGS